MNRKILIRAIALFFIFGGLWSIGIFLWPLLTSSKVTGLNLFLVVLGIIYIRVGDNLFKLSNFGRKFALVLLSLQALWNALFLLLSLFVKKKEVLFASALFGELSFTPGNNYWVLVQVLAISLAMVFLLHKETRIMFLPEKKGIPYSDAHGEPIIS